MTIYVVKPGDSIFKIARQFGISPDSIISLNELTNPSRLVVGQALVIPSPDNKIRTIEVNGYAFPEINPEALRRSIPNLTYLSIFSYQVSSDGSLSTINDTPLITQARAARVAPIMVITNIQEGGGFSSSIAHSVLTQAGPQRNLIDNVKRILREKNYHGLNIDFEYVFPYDRASYNNFLGIITSELRPLGYMVITSLAPKTSGTQQGLLYEAHDYPVHGRLADRVILMTYEWGYTLVRASLW